MRGLLVGSLLGLARTLDRGVTVITHVAAGLLRFDALGRHMGENWRHFGVTQTEPDVADGLFTWERSFYGRFMTPGERVLIVGCGGGRDLLPLLEQGYCAEGLEPVAVCAAMARERVASRGLTATVYTADIHYEHQFQPAEIEAEAHAAGLSVAFHEHTSDGEIALTRSAPLGVA